MSEFSITRKLLAWAVHLFTASGLVAGFMAILAIHNSQWREAMVWLIVSMFIDGIDGTFARLAKVKEVLPYMNGTTIDYVIDFATYAIIPAYFFYQTGIVDETWRMPCTAMILLVSALYYGKEGMVSNDMYFVGFPVMWNMVVFYQFFVFDLPSWMNVVAIIILSAMHFIPIKFVYPSRALRLQKLSIFVSVIFFISNGFILYFYPEEVLWAKYLSISTIFYFGIMAIYDTWVIKELK